MPFLCSYRMCITGFLCISSDLFIKQKIRSSVLPDFHQSTILRTLNLLSFKIRTHQEGCRRCLKVTSKVKTHEVSKAYHAVLTKTAMVVFCPRLLVTSVPLLSKHPQPA